MGFNLGQFLHGVEAQINPFDHGQTFATVTRSQSPKQAPPPASTARPQINTRQLTNQVNNMANIGPAAVARQPGAPINYVNPVAGLARAATSLPLIHEAYQFTQLPQSQQTVPNFLKGITGVGYNFSPLGSAERTAARAAATVQQAPFHLPGVATQLPVNKEIGQAKGTFDKALAAAGIAGDVLGAKEPFAAGGTAAVRGVNALNKTVDNLAPGEARLSQAGHVAVPSAAPKIAPNKFTESVQHSPEVSPEVQQAVSGQHAVRNTEQLMSASRDQIRTEGLPASTEGVLHDLAVEPGKASDTTLAKALEVAKAHDALGTQAGHDMATSLYDQISEHGVAKGQGVQILSQIARRSPAGLRNKAFKDLKKAGVEVTPQMKAEIQGHIDAVSKMPEGPARDFAVAVLQKSVAKHLPQTATSKAISIWKAGLLSGVKTQGGNFLSNATFGVLKKASDVPAALVDKGLSLGTGQRTKTLSLRGGSGIGEGLKNAKTTLKTGIDVRNVGDKYEQHAEINFKNPVMQKVFGDPSNLVFRGMNAADQPFYYASLKNSLYDQAKADGLSQGLHGAKLSAHMDNLVRNPSSKMVETATNDAQKSVLGQDSKVASAVSEFARKIPGGQVLAPFTKVPTNFITRTLDFTPVGTIKELGMLITKKKQFDQRALATAIGEGATGSGIIYLGAQLANNGMLSGDYPKNDPKEAARWKAEGITPNSIKLGGKWISLNYLGPLGLLLNAGKSITDSAKQGGNIANEATAGVGGLGQGLLSQSFLQGFSGFSDAIKNPARNAQTFLNSEVGSLVPSWMNDIANATDSMQRQANSPVQAAEARVPGLRQTLAPKTDAFGNDLSQASGSGLNTAVNPLKPSSSIDSPMLSELNRLAATGKDNAVFPTTVKTIGSGSSQIKLTPDQASQRQKLVGQAITPLWSQLIKSPDYTSLDDAHKAQVLQAALTDVNGAVDRTMTARIDSSKLGKPATGNVADILTGHGPTAADYLARAQGKPQNPQQKYQQDAAAFQRKQSEGKLTAVQSFRGQESLNREAITSKFPQDVVDFYNLSKADMNAYFKQDPQKAKQLYDQARQLDGQLTQQLGSTTKFKYRLGTKPKKAKAARTHKAGTVKSTSKGGFNYAKLTAVKASSTDTGALRKLVGAPKFTRKAVKAAKAPSGKLKKIKASKIA